MAYNPSYIYLNYNSNNLLGNLTKTHKSPYIVDFYKIKSNGIQAKKSTIKVRL